MRPLWASGYSSVIIKRVFVAIRNEIAKFAFTLAKATNMSNNSKIQKWEFTDYTNSLVVVSKGKGRGTLYQVNIKRPQNVAISEGNVATSKRAYENVAISEGNVATSKRAYVYETAKKHLSYNEIADLICNMTKDFLFLDEIASSIGRNVRYLNNRIIPRMIEEQRLERLYPDIPNHPKQKYRAKNNK